MTGAPEALNDLARIQEASFARASEATARAFPSHRRMGAAMLGTFLSSKQTGVFATTREDGRPHAAPVGFAIVGSRFVIPSLEGAARVANLRHTPYASLVVTEDDEPQAVVIVEGTARVLGPMDASLEMRAPFREHDGSLPAWIDVLVVLTPERVLSYAGEGFAP